jgi:hypothetical protein
MLISSRIRRLGTLGVRALAGLALALPIACLQVTTALPSRSDVIVAAQVLECPVGSLGCPCTGGGGCDPGLECMDGYCGHAGRGGVTVYMFEDDVMAEPMAEVSVESKRSLMRAPAKAKLGGRQREGRLENAAGRAPAPIDVAPEPSMPVPVDVTSTGATSSETREPTQEQAEDARLVIYTAGLDVAVYELDAAVELAESIPERFGGWIESRYDYQITLRVPAERLFEVIALLSDLGLVLGKSLRADDVTAEFTDLASRILVLEQLVEQLELLLAQAKTVEEALKIRIELDRVRVELESARTRMRALSEMIDFSTLTLRLSQRGDLDVLPSGNDPFPWVDDLGVETTEYR